MPSYEYRCLSCMKRFEIFISYADYGSQSVVCAYCQSADVQRRIGRIRVARASGIDSLDDPSAFDNLSGLEDDPRALGRRLREMSRETGEELGEEFDEVVGRLEAGQAPEQIEKELPALESDEGDSGIDPSGEMET